MAYYLQFDGIDDFLAFDADISFNIGVDAYAFEFTANIKSFPSTLTAGIVGTGTSSTGGIVMRAASPVNSLALVSSNASRYDSGADFIILNELHTYRLEHDSAASGGQYRWYRDDVLFSSGNYTSSINLVLKVFGKTKSDGLWSDMDVYSFEFISGFSNNPTYPVISFTGIGNRLIDAGGTNSATINGAQWVYYNDGPVDIPAGTGSDSIQLNTAGVGYRASSATGDDSTVCSVAAAGYRESAASGSDTATLYVTGAGYHDSAASGGDVLTVTIRGDGAVPGVIPAGGGSDSITASVAAVGYHQSYGSSSDTGALTTSAVGYWVSAASGLDGATLTITGIGLAPSDVPRGYGADSLTLAISGSGYRQSAASGVNTLTLSAGAIGYRESSASAVNTLTVTIGGEIPFRFDVLVYNTSSERYTVYTGSERLVIND